MYGREASESGSDGPGSVRLWGPRDSLRSSLSWRRGLDWGEDGKAQLLLCFSGSRVGMSRLDVCVRSDRLLESLVPEGSRAADFRRDWPLGLGCEIRGLSSVHV